MIYCYHSLCKTTYEKKYWTQGHRNFPTIDPFKKALREFYWSLSLSNRFTTKVSLFPHEVTRFTTWISKQHWNLSNRGKGIECWCYQATGSPHTPRLATLHRQPIQTTAKMRQRNHHNKSNNKNSNNLSKFHDKACDILFYFRFVEILFYFLAWTRVLTIEWSASLFSVERGNLERIISQKS